MQRGTDFLHKKVGTSCACSELEAPPGIEPGVKVLQTSALPLGYGAIFDKRRKRKLCVFCRMERKTRFELATLALARRCSTTEPLPHILVEGDGFEPSKAELTDLQSAPFSHSGTPPNSGTMPEDIPHNVKLLELVEGIEPPTC